MEHEDCFYFYFKKELLKTFRTLLVIDRDTVIIIIIRYLNTDDSDSISDTSSPNDSMEESQCAKEQNYSESTNTEEQNSQNEPYHKIAELTSNGRLKGFFVSEIVVNLSYRKRRQRFLFFQRV